MVSNHLAEQARESIKTSLVIERTVLDMDRLMEKSRRLHGDFFLQYERIGLAEAHVQFAQPSVRLVAEAIKVSADLRKMLEQSTVGQALAKENQSDLNFYLASAKRFADTSIASIELITKLASPEHGLEAAFSRLMQALRSETLPHPQLHARCLALVERYQDYRISRQRHVMQSAFNALVEIQQQVEAPSALEREQAARIGELLRQVRSAGEAILETDLAIKSIFNDFNIQAKNVGPIAQVLVQRAGAEVQRAREEVRQTLRLASFLFGLFSITAILSSVLVLRFITRNVTGRIHGLTEAASRLQEGDFTIAVAEQPDDELGHLGRTFNMMSSRIRELVNGLESQVAQRTEQLAGSERRFRLVTNELPNIGIIGYDRDGRIVFWNRTSERLYGWSAEEAVGRSVLLLTAEGEERDVFRGQLRGWIERGRAIPAGEAVFRHEGGAPVHVYVSHFTVADAHGGHELFSLHIDLADLKRAQEESRLRESVYRSLFDHTSSGVGVCEAVEGGMDFILQDINKAGETIEGRQREEMVGRRLTEIFPGVAEVGLLAELARVWRSGEPVFLPPTLYEYGGQRRWQQGHIYKIPTGEVVYVYDDVTRLRETELAKEAMEARLERSRKMEAIGLLAGGVAHDLNNILSGIIGYPEIMLMQMDEHSKLRKPLLAIQSSGQRAAAVVADLLTVARGVSSERRRWSLNRLVDEYLASPEHEATMALHPGVACRFLPASPLWFFFCSSVHIKKSVMNLVTNAAEAIQLSGTITITTRNECLEHTEGFKTEMAPGRYVVLEVADSGSGIADKDIEHIFEPFYTRKVMGRSGTGLGLAVVWNTVLDHRGGIKVASSNRGTVFSLYFPASMDAAVADDANEEAPAPRGTGQRILVVDDEMHQRDIASQFLTMLGYEVWTAGSGEEAIETLRRRQVDLVLLDMLMGTGMNGRQTYESAVAIRPGQKALIVSGFAADEDVRRTLRLGGAGYLQKPYTQRKLGFAVHAALHSPE